MRYGCRVFDFALDIRLLTVGFVVYDLDVGSDVQKSCDRGDLQGGGGSLSSSESKSSSR